MLTIRILWISEMALNDHTRVIGYFAYASPTHVVCDGDACIVAGSEARMKRYLEAAESSSQSDTRIKKTRLGEILNGLELGGAYAFDEEAFNRFQPLAEKAGLARAPQDFSGPTPTGRHFVRIQIIDVE